MTNHRDAITGKFVTAEHAAASPDTTVSESPCTECERLRGIVHTQEIAINGYREEVERLRDELPIVRTVGDLTARHIGKRVRVRDDVDGDTEGVLAALDSGATVNPRLVDVRVGEEWVLAPIDTPVEVL